MPDLTSKQRADLRSRAHALKPIVHVGKEGVTPSAVRSLQQTFDTHDLVKVRVLETAPEDVRATANALVAGIQEAVVVQTVGRNATLFRPLPKPEPPTTPPKTDSRKTNPRKKAAPTRGRRAKRA